MAKCWKCGAEVGGLSAYSPAPLCPACRLVEQQEEAERRRREEEKSRREEEEWRREEEKLQREIEELEREEEREREREKDEQWRRMEMSRREEEKADAAARGLYRRSKPHCLWCGKSYVFESGHGFGEYCCRKCAVNAKVDMAEYEARMEEILIGKVKEHLYGSPVTAALYAVGVKELPFEQLGSLASELERVEPRRGEIEALYRKFHWPFEWESERRRKRAALLRLEEEEARVKRELGEEKIRRAAEAERNRRAKAEKPAAPEKIPDPDIVCPFCGKTAKGDRSLEGKPGECPYCGKSFVIHFGGGGDK